MTEKAIIVKIDDEKIYASYCSSEKCSACSSECEKKKTIFEVENPNHKLLKAGMSVLISASKRNQVIQGLLALFVPFLCSIIGYVSSPYIMTFFGKRISSAAFGLFSESSFIFAWYKVITGEEELTSGDVFRNSKFNISYLKQNALNDSRLTVRQEFYEVFKDSFDVTEMSFKKAIKIADELKEEFCLQPYD